MLDNKRMGRQFRPVADPLESLSPVSLLLPGLPVESSGLLSPVKQESEAPAERPSHVVAVKEIAQPRQIQLIPGIRDVPGREANQGSQGFTKPSQPTEIAASLQGSLTPLQNISNWNSTLTTQDQSIPEGPKVPQTRSTSASIANPTVTSHSTSHITPNSSKASSTNPSSSSESGPSASVTPSRQGSTPGAIRPLSLAPASDPSPSKNPSNHQISSLYESGGYPPADHPPELLATGGNAAATSVQGSGGAIPGKYKLTHDVPIGSKIDIWTGNQYTITSHNWSGGSVYSNYFDTSPYSTCPTEVKLEKNVISTSSFYSFIIPSTPSHFEISVHVSYSDGSSGDSTLEFDSVRPTGNLKDTPGTQTYDTTSTQAFVYLDPGLYIQATATTTAYTAGYFMFMQILNKEYHYSIDNNGNSYYNQNNIPPGVGEPNFNGPLHDGSETAYRYTLNNGNILYDRFYLPDSSSTPATTLGFLPRMHDSPKESVDINWKEVSLKDEFSTYLMYYPSFGGVWIALCKLDWTFDATAKSPGGGTGWTGPNVVQPDAHVSTPTGDDAFPTWVNTTPNWLEAPDRPGNPGPGPTFFDYL